MTRKVNPNPEPVETLTPEQILDLRRAYYLKRPATKGDVIRCILAIRQIQQQLGITPLLRLRLEISEGDDDNSGRILR